jgi:hypothetical protein
VPAEFLAINGQAWKTTTDRHARLPPSALRAGNRPSAVIVANELL